MLDDTISVVQVVMAPKHPLTDICDYHAKANLFGLGPGCYPKAKAPKPVFHPFCRCVVRSRPDLSAAIAREVPGAEAAHLRTLPIGDAARMVGSRDKLQRVLNGTPLDDVLNTGKDPAYHLTRLGQLDLSKVHPARVPLGVKVTADQLAPAPVVAPVVPPVVVAPPWFSGKSTDRDEFKQRGREKLREFLQRTMPDDKFIVPIISQRGMKLDDLLNDSANLPYVATVLRHFINDDLKKVRSVGGVKISTVAKTGKGVAIMKKTASVYPDDWVRAGNFQNIKVVESNKRGFYRPAGLGQNQPPEIFTDDSSTAVHEYAHHLQNAMKELDKIFQDEHRARTLGEKLMHIPGDVPSAMAKKDGYYDIYQGREYSFHPNNPALEVLTMAIQPVLGSDQKSTDFFISMFSNDLDMLRLTIGVLFHFKP